jgi:SAM-dependent MidA family methyltransferase
MKFLQIIKKIILGLGSSLSTHACPWCSLTVSEKSILIDSNELFDSFSIEVLIHVSANNNDNGAYISFKEELIKYVKSNVSADSQVLKVKISGDGSKVSRISKQK